MQLQHGFITAFFTRFAERPFLAYCANCFLGTVPSACKDWSLSCVRSTQPVPPPSSLPDSDMLVYDSVLEGLRSKSYELEIKNNGLMMSHGS